MNWKSWVLAALVRRSIGREALCNAGLLFAGTKRIGLATGIANIYARDAMAMASGQKTLAETYPNRFLLGLGVSHVPLVEQLRGHRYEKPVATMRAYLDAMDQAPYIRPPCDESPRACWRHWGRRCWSLRANKPTAHILTT